MDSHLSSPASPPIERTRLAESFYDPLPRRIFSDLIFRSPHPGMWKPYEELDSQAEKGDPIAQRQVGDRLLCGFDPGKKDPKRAYEWYVKSANLGDPRSQCMMGFCYTYGVGVEKKRVEASRWFVESATSLEKTLSDDHQADERSNLFAWFLFARHEKRRADIRERREFRRTQISSLRRRIVCCRGASRESQRTSSSISGCSKKDR